MFIINNIAADIKRTSMQAYTYSIKHIPTNTIYYGVRKSSTFDLGHSYLSSSKLVKRMIEEDGLENFEFKQRRMFESYEEARLHESKILKRIDAVKNPRVLNQAISSPRLCNKDSVSEKQRRNSISESMKKLWEIEEYKENQSFNKLTKEERSKRGRNGALKRAENIKNGLTIINRKPKNTKTMHVIEKHGTEKIISPSAVPAYLKCGYIKVRIIQIPL